MNVSAISPTVTLFGENKTKSVSNTKNPISKAGEKANLVKATFLAGLGFGIRVLFELMDGDFIFEKLGDTTNNCTCQLKDGSITNNSFSNLISGDDISNQKHSILMNSILQ